MKQLLAEADTAREAQRFLEAAALLDEAYAIYPDSRLLANAGYSRMMGGAQVEAIRNFEAALDDQRLVGEVRDKAVERLETSRGVLELTKRADERARLGDFAQAAEGYDRAFEKIPVGAYLVKAATLWDRAEKRALARERFQRAESRTDLSETDRVLVARGLTARSVRPDSEPAPEPEEPADGSITPIIGWVAVGVGAAALGLGIAGFAVSSSEHSAAEETSDFDAYQDHDANAETWWNVGLVATTVGVAAGATGVVLLLTDDDGRETRGSVEVGGAPTRGGGYVTATLSF